MSFANQPQLYITACIGVIGILALLRLLLLYRENRLLSDQLTQTSVSLDCVRKERDRLREDLEREPVFDRNLHDAGITTELQQSRLSAQTAPARSTIPEKYSLITSMMQKGMSGEEIASLLSISMAEAEQLVSLSRIASDQFDEEVV